MWRVTLEDQMHVRANVKGVYEADTRDKLYVLDDMVIGKLLLKQMTEN